jgi:hypothetical protein
LRRDVDSGRVCNGIFPFAYRDARLRLSSRCSRHFQYATRSPLARSDRRRRIASAPSRLHRVPAISIRFRVTWPARAFDHTCRNRQPRLEVRVVLDVRLMVLERSAAGAARAVARRIVWILSTTFGSGAAQAPGISTMQECARSSGKVQENSRFASMQRSRTQISCDGKGSFLTSGFRPSSPKCGRSLRGSTVQ